MLDLDDVRALQRVVEPTATSILLSTGPGDAARLDALLREAQRRLELELSPEEAAARIDSLRVLAETVGEDRGHRAIALFASASCRAASRLPEPVEDRVVVDDTFATRDLVLALTRSPEYLVVQFTDPGARLWAGTGPVVREVVDDRFPVHRPAPGEAERGRRHDPGAARARAQRDLVREVDRALDRHLAGDDRPVFLLGSRVTMAAYARSSRHQRRIHGSAVLGPRVAAAGVSQSCRPLVEQWLADRRQDALLGLERARSSRRFAAGLDEVWPLANEGRGAHLVVEAGFTRPAVVVGDRLDPAADPTAPGVVDDVVDEVIEAVLGAGGEVDFVADGELADHGRIALRLRH